MQNQNDHDAVVNHAVSQLGSIFNAKIEPRLLTKNLNEAIWEACRHIGENLNITLSKPIFWKTITNIDDLVMAIGRESQIRVRKITLSGQWWKQDNGPLLIFDRELQHAFAIIRENKKYYIFDPDIGKSKKLTSATLQKLAIEGYMFYRSFEPKALKISSLLKFAFTGQKKELRRIIILQSLLGLIALVIPIATGILLNKVIPNAALNLLWQWILALVVFAFSATFFTAAQIFSFIRLRIKINAYTQAAIWDRLLRLPLTFFKQFSPGDLALRASGIDTIQQQLTNASLGAFFGSIFALFSLALMFYYSVLLATLILILFIIVVLLTVLSAYIQLQYQRPIAYLQGKLASLTLQFLTSISKLRVSHSENRAFDLWAQSFTHKSRLTYKALLWQMYFTITITLLMLLGLLGLFAIVGSGVVPINFGSFIAFNAAYGQFLASLLASAQVFIVLIQIAPQYERILPILNTLPEDPERGEKLLPLKGAIEMKSVNFRYQFENPWVLQDISLEIKPGEMIALAGATGCGKSTLIRLLLGFENPTSGQIFYDGHGLSEINLRVLREQLGVVLQNTTLLAGTIFENIKGTKDISQDEAWEALAQASLVDDIKAMPMGLYTLVAEWGKTLSLGQRQRLTIARALISKPKMIIFDEPTSALDNPTQAKIMQHLQTMPITRIIVTHRLSALEHVDRIYVLKAGKIVQAGHYKELLAEKGEFYHLSKQQRV